jgi:hypothetical protein
VIYAMKSQSCLSRDTLHAVTTALFVGIAGLVAIAPIELRAESPKTKINFKSNGIGVPPADFEFWRTGQGSVAQWAVVRDATASGGASIEQFGGIKPRVDTRWQSIEEIEITPLPEREQRDDSESPNDRRIK